MFRESERHAGIAGGQSDNDRNSTGHARCQPLRQETPLFDREAADFACVAGKNQAIDTGLEIEIDESIEVGEGWRPVGMERCRQYRKHSFKHDLFQASAKMIAGPGAAGGHCSPLGRVLGAAS